MARLYQEVLVLPAVVQELADGCALGFDLPDPTDFPWVRILRPESMAILPVVSDLGAGEEKHLPIHGHGRWVGKGQAAGPARRRRSSSGPPRFPLDTQTRAAVLRRAGEEVPCSP